MAIRRTLFAALLAISVLASCHTAQSQTGAAAANDADTGTTGPVIARSIKDSTPFWPAPVRAPEGAPNVLLVMTDDVGFGASNTFGGPIPTLNLDRIAAEGTLFNRFHTTAICSPTRAALLTGRNAHNSGVGILSDMPSGYPGYSGEIPDSTATIAKVLTSQGYSTAMFGKHHNTPPSQQSAAGPFDQWPTGLGFEYFFGFIGGDVSQWHPRLFRGTNRVEVDGQGEKILDELVADDIITWIHNQKAAAQDKPFFVYWAPGTLHAPHQAPKDWIARFQGKFDAGWDVLRETTFARQKELGLIPENAVLTPRPDIIPAWDSLSPEEQRYHARMMEVAAAMLAYQDHQFGKIINELERMGELDNTLIIYVQGDNGGSGEGEPGGVTNELGSLLNGVVDDTLWMNSQLDEMGGPDTYQNYAMGWGWAMNTPFPYTKQFANFLGGIRNGLVIREPANQTSTGHTGISSQFSHVIDIAPTIYQYAGVEFPEEVDGVTQKPLDGFSLKTAIDTGELSERTQYFEITGAIGIYENGWFANTPARRMPWEVVPPDDTEPEDLPWELYNLDEDFTQSSNLARDYPEKLEHMKQVFDTEAWKYNVYPIDQTFSSGRLAAVMSNPYRSKQTQFTYWGSDVSVAGAVAPSFAARSFSVEVEADLTADSEGVLVAVGSLFGGWSFIFEDNAFVCYQAASNKPSELYRVSAPAEFRDGLHRIAFKFQSDGGLRAGGVLSIYLDDELIGQGRMEKTILRAAGIGETFDIGRDTGVQVVPAPSYTDEIRRVDVTLN